MSSLNSATMEQSLWRDSKRHLWLLSPLVPILGLSTVFFYQLSGLALFAWGGPILVYILIPLLDRLIGEDHSNPPESAVTSLESDSYYRWIVYAYIPSQIGLTLLAAWTVFTYSPTVFEWIGLALTAGTINGIAINTAHELGHKKQSLDRWLAKLTLAPVAYGHFYVEHNRGHHKNVATPNDPASSKMGESFWAFLPRTMLGSVKSAWSIEAQRLARLGKSAWTFDNDNLQAWSLSLALFGGICLWLEPGILWFLLAQAFFGASLLEVINYIEHYGLLRQKDANGRYVRCAPEHSWNSNHVVTNLFLYQLQRHSDHHANPTRRFQALRHFDESPQLPSGYASMLIPAYIPWLWFHKMDPLVAKHYGGDIRKANVFAKKREKLLARWQSQPVDKEIQPVNTPASSETPHQISQHKRFACTDCGYIYDENLGCAHEGFPAGTRWTQIPDDWPCPDCAVREKQDFIPLD